VVLAVDEVLSVDAVLMRCAQPTPAAAAAATATKARRFVNWLMLNSCCKRGIALRRLGTHDAARHFAASRQQQCACRG
jgi:hypothetical protein